MSNANNSRRQVRLAALTMMLLGLLLLAGTSSSSTSISSATLLSQTEATTFRSLLSSSSMLDELMVQLFQMSSGPMSAQQRCGSPPTITSFEPKIACAGEFVTIHGTGFDGGCGLTVKFNGIPDLDRVTVDSPTQIRAIVPAAESDPIGCMTRAGGCK